MKLINLIPLKEIDFRNQDQFDDYTKNHELRPDTKVTINGKVTTAGQAAKNSEPVKGTSVFGKSGGGSVFGKSDGMETVKSIAAKTGLRAQAVAGWADENGVNLSKVSADIDSKKLKPMDMMTAVSGNPGNKYAKDIITKYSQSAPKADNIESLTSYEDFNKFFKANSDKINKNDLAYIEDEIGALKYLESDYKKGKADRQEVEVAYVELQDLIKKALPKDSSTKLSPMIPKSTGGAKNKSITDIKVDTQVDVSTLSKSLLPNIRLGDGSGLPDKDAIELVKRLASKDSGVYTRTSPHGGNIVFKDGTRFEVFRPHDAQKTKSTTIYASKR
jgi:hypothetical protein